MVLWECRLIRWLGNNAYDTARHVRQRCNRLMHGTGVCTRGSLLAAYTRVRINVANVEKSKERPSRTNDGTSLNTRHEYPELSRACCLVRLRGTRSRIKCTFKADGRNFLWPHLKNSRGHVFPLRSVPFKNTFPWSCASLTETKIDKLFSWNSFFRLVIM